MEAMKRINADLAVHKANRLEYDRIIDKSVEMYKSISTGATTLLQTAKKTFVRTDERAAKKAGVDVGQAIASLPQAPPLI